MMKTNFGAVLALLVLMGCGTADQKADQKTATGPTAGSGARS